MSDLQDRIDRIIAEQEAVIEQLESDERAESRTDPRANTESAVGADESDSETTMPDDDEQKIETLVEHGLSRENLEPLAGTECLGRIHETFVDAEDADADEPSTETPDTPETPDAGAEGAGSTDTEPGPTETDGGTDPLADIDLESLIAERVDERLEEQAGDLADKVDEARQNEQHIQTVAESDDYPLDRDALEGMSPDAVAQLAETVDEPDDGGRANYAGLAAGSSFDAGDVSPDDGLDSIPAPGTVPEPASGGDD